MARDLLPDRPLRLTRQYLRGPRNAAKLLVAGAILAALGAWLSLNHELAKIAAERATWEHGVPCHDSVVDAKHEGNDDHARLTITCTAPDGSIHRATVEGSWSAFEDLDRRDAEVRYDPARVDAVAVDEVLGDRPHRIVETWVIAIAFGAIALLALGFAGGLGVKMWRVRQLARRGDEVQAEIVDIAAKYRRGNKTYVRFVRWRVSPTGRLFRSRIKHDDGLAWIDATAPRALALVRGKQGLLLTGSIEPLDLSTDELTRVKATLENAGGGLMRTIDASFSRAVSTDLEAADRRA